MSKTIECGQVVPGCKFTAEANTEQELLQKVAEHAREAHGVTEVTPELEEYIQQISGAVDYVNQTFSLFRTAEKRRPKTLLKPARND